MLLAGVPASRKIRPPVKAARGLAAGTARAEGYNVRRYHQTGDEFDPSWTFEGAAQEARVAWRIGAELASNDGWPSWRPGVRPALTAPSRAAGPGTHSGPESMTGK